MCCHVWFYISFCQIYVFGFFLGSVFKCMLWQCCNSALVRSVHGNTWLGLGKDRVLAWHTCFGRHNNSRNMSPWEISSGVLLSNHVVFWQKCSAVSHFETHLELRSVAFGSLGLLHRHPITPWYERFRSYTCKGTLRWQMLWKCQRDYAASETHGCERNRRHVFLVTGPLKPTTELLVKLWVFSKARVFSMKSGLWIVCVSCLSLCTHILQSLLYSRMLIQDTCAF